MVGIFATLTFLNQAPAFLNQPSTFFIRSDKPSTTVQVSDFEANFGKENELDGCYHIYLDVGSNIGIQVRKLFEPGLYPNASVLEVFDTYFGPIDSKGQRQDTVCAVGFEPNPHHTLALKSIEEAHRACGWRTTFYTGVAAAHDYGTIEFLSDNDPGNKEWGGSIVADQRKHKVRYTLMLWSCSLVPCLTDYCTRPLGKGRVSQIR